MLLPDWNDAPGPSASHFALRGTSSVLARGHPIYRPRQKRGATKEDSPTGGIGRRPRYQGRVIVAETLRRDPARLDGSIAPPPHKSSSARSAPGFKRNRSLNTAARSGPRFADVRRTPRRVGEASVMVGGMRHARSASEVAMLAAHCSTSRASKPWRQCSPRTRLRSFAGSRRAEGWYYFRRLFPTRWGYFP